ERVDVEAGVRARVAGRAHLVHRHEQRVAVAVERGTADVLDVPARVALPPVLPSAARPEGDAARREGAAQRLGVHVAEHEDVPRPLLLDDRRQQPVAVPADAIEHDLHRTGLGHRTGTPSARSASLTCPTVSSPLWNTDAASTASAPASTAGAKCSSRPAPPLAMTGTALTSRTARTSSRSNPSFVPSASIELTSSSPAPRSTPSRAHSIASRSVSVRPPCVVTTNPLGVRSVRLTSSESTSTWAPNRS